MSRRKIDELEGYTVELDKKECVLRVNGNEIYLRDNRCNVKPSDIYNAVRNHSSGMSVKESAQRNGMAHSTLLIHLKLAGVYPEKITPRPRKKLPGEPRKQHKRRDGELWGYTVELREEIVVANGIEVSLRSDIESSKLVAALRDHSGGKSVTKSAQDNEVSYHALLRRLKLAGVYPNSRNSD